MYVVTLSVFFIAPHFIETGFLDELRACHFWIVYLARFPQEFWVVYLAKFPQEFWVVYLAGFPQEFHLCSPSAQATSACYA